MGAELSGSAAERERGQVGAKLSRSEAKRERGQVGAGLSGSAAKRELRSVGSAFGKRAMLYGSGVLDGDDDCPLPSAPAAVRKLSEASDPFRKFPAGFGRVSEVSRSFGSGRFSSAPAAVPCATLRRASAVPHPGY